MAYVQKFASWEDLLDLVKQTGKDEMHSDCYLLYRAPMDYYPALVHVVKTFKNGKIRIKANGITFTADSGHLGRFVKSLREKVS